MGELGKRVDSHVGRQIRKRRNLLGLTQEELAEALGISYQQIQKYETSANRISAGRLYEIAQKLGTTIGYFFEELDETRHIGTLEHGGKARTAVDLVRNFDRIKDSDLRTTLSALVREIADRVGGTG
ncbi:MAG: helix-turn-helix transcriptional regulator [Alphaproteobacteria bacterium]|nr:helix-turn-helix transcriptional regulator [Alphaproteobacteria bacterium]